MEEISFLAGSSIHLLGLNTSQENKLGVQIILRLLKNRKGLLNHKSSFSPFFKISECLSLFQKSKMSQV